MLERESKVYYIHGLYGSVNSMKFKHIKQLYPNGICLEWKFNKNIDLFIENSFNQLKVIDELIYLIGSSVGGNFAWQLQQLLLAEGKECKLLLINPLVDFSYKHEDNFPQQLVQFLKPMKNFTKTKVIIGLQDEVLDANLSRRFFEELAEKDKNQLDIILTDDDHRISNFESLNLDL